MADLCLAGDPESLIYTAIFFVVGCCGVWLIWLAKQPLPPVGPDRTELDNSEPLVSVDRVNINRRNDNAERD